ncbi:CTR copper uptake transporter [Lyophyllum atratum]|nr:CTR copper uptake transporter [Lyophyllum atratum]
MASLLPFLLSLFLPALTYAQHAHSSTNGLDPAMDMPMSLAHGHMSPFLHFAPGDTLWLDGWVPGRGSTLLGACVGLFLLGVMERWVGALRMGVEGALRRDLVGQRKRRNSMSIPEKRESSEETTHRLRDVLLMRGGTAAPFVLSHAWARFLLQCTQAALAFLFMLAVMSFQVSFILSIVIGLGVGEMMYGRFTDAVEAGMHEGL